jgi:hypothetical protein
MFLGFPYMHEYLEYSIIDANAADLTTAAWATSCSFGDLHLQLSIGRLDHLDLSQIFHDPGSTAVNEFLSRVASAYSKDFSSRGYSRFDPAGCVFYDDALRDLFVQLGRSSQISVCILIVILTDDVSDIAERTVQGGVCRISHRWR